MTRLVLIVALLAALCVSAAMFYDNYRLETEGDVIYSEAAEEFVITHAIATEAATTSAPAQTQPGETTAQTEPTEAQTEATEEQTAPRSAPARPIITDAESVEVDFERLLQVNPEVVGWVIIENTAISYPVLHGEDNDKYLTTTYNNKYSKYGSIFVDYRLKGDFTGRHTLVYGHNMRNSSMFGTLLRFTEQSYWQSRRYFHILLPDGGVLKYEIFAAYKADVGSDTYTVSFRDREHYAEVLEKMLAWSEVDTGVAPDTGDKIVTLCTCTSSSNERDTKRYVVHGRLISDSRLEQTDSQSN